MKKYLLFDPQNYAYMAYYSYLIYVGVNTILLITVNSMNLLSDVFVIASECSPQFAPEPNNNTLGWSRFVDNGETVNLRSVIRYIGGDTTLTMQDKVHRFVSSYWHRDFEYIAFLRIPYGLETALQAYDARFIVKMDGVGVEGFDVDPQRYEMVIHSVNIDPRIEGDAKRIFDAEMKLIEKYFMHQKSYEFYASKISCA